MTKMTERYLAQWNGKCADRGRFAGGIGADRAHHTGILIQGGCHELLRLAGQRAQDLH